MQKNVIIYIAIIGFLLVGLAAAAIVAILALRGTTNAAFEKNAANPTLLTFPTEVTILSTPIEVETPQPTEESTVEPTLSETSLPETPVETSTLQSPCGISGKLMILYIGQDEGLELPPYGADIIRLANYNFDENKVSIFAFPRDLLLSTPTLNSRYGISSDHLGDVYDIVMKREGTDPNAKQTATLVVLQTISENFNLTPDYYVNFNLTVVKSLIDGMGGIDVNLPYPLTTTNYQFMEGLQHLDGQAVWEYSTEPSVSYDEWERFSRQDAVFYALREKMMDESIFPNLSSQIQSSRPALLTDLSEAQIGMLLCSMLNISNENIALSTFPQTMVTIYEDHSIVLKDQQAAQQLLENSLNW